MVDEMVIGAVALGPCLGGLDATVDGLGKAIAQAGAEVFEDAVPGKKAKRDGGH